ncbi:AsmA-like C-terminal domain-containing protein [Campylobacter fetus]|uniref:YhdP family protein n=1 Tax=Campylobacter fetus TaxID=196 RepID=UPI00138DF923|nr:AsmA-like C-terminal domain-containing protein [Campylobacter fetus]
MRAISQTIKKARFFLIFSLTIIIALILTLINGIRIDSFDSELLRIEKLYIKLDKKLIVNIKNIEIYNKKSEQSSSKELLDIADNAIWLGRLFKEINIENISYQDINSTLLYKDDIFYVNTPYLTINTQIENKNKVLIANVSELSLKDFNITINGNLVADLYDNRYYFGGKFSSYELSGDIGLNLKNNILDYNISNVNANSIEKFIDNLAKKTDLHTEIKNWIYGYIIAKQYTLYSLHGKLNLKNLNFYPNELYAKAVAKDLSIKFHENVTPIKSNLTYVELKNDSLFFYLEKPTYMGKSLDGSSVVIRNIIGKDSNMSVNITTNSFLDNDIHAILKAYDIDFPVSQKSGNLDSNLTLDIVFDPFSISSNGEFILKDADVDIGGAEFYTKYANIYLKDNVIKFKNSNLVNMIFDANIEGELDTNLKKAKFDAKFNKLCVDKCQIFEASDINDTINLDYNKDLNITADKLNLSINIAKNNQIELKNLKDIKQYSPLMQKSSIIDGDLLIQTPDFSKFDVDFSSAKFDLPFLNLQNNPYNEDHFKIFIDKNVDVISKSDHFKMNITDSDINLNLNNLKLLVDANSSKKEYEKNINFIAKNSSIIITDLNRTLNFTKFSGNINNNELNFDGSFDNGEVKLNRQKNSVKIEGDGLDASFVNDFLGLDGFKDGNFTVRLSGENFTKFKSEIKVSNTYLSNYKFYQQFLSFLDSIPSLLIFKVPDFNDKGFTVNNGIMLVQRDDNLLTIKAIDLSGSSADITGNGTIDLKTKDIDMTFQLKLLKDASSIISKIPVVNHIFLGKDKTISTVIKVRGTLDEPKFETQVVTDIIKTPYNIIKNTLELPFILFN